MTPRALTIAGSDVSGGAGIEADLKMFQESGVFGTAVLTCIVTFDPENDFGHALDFMEPDTVQRQLDSTLAVHRFDVLKSGMLGSVESALVLAERLRTNELPYVFDPVLVCKGAGTMVDLKDLFVENLVPLAHVITPNLEEAATLTGADALTSVDEMAEAARAIHAQGATNVVIKGGARLAGDEAIDVLFDGETLTTFSSRRSRNTSSTARGVHSPRPSPPRSRTAARWPTPWPTPSSASPVASPPRWTTRSASTRCSSADPATAMPGCPR